MTNSEGDPGQSTGEIPASSADDSLDVTVRFRKPEPPAVSSAPAWHDYFDIPLMTRRLEDWIWSEPHNRARGPMKLFWRMIQVFALAIRNYADHQCEMRASALTYRSFLSFIPLLAVGFAIMKRVGLQETLAEYLIERLTTGTENPAEEGIPTIVDSINRTVDFINETQVGGLTGIGIIGFLMVGVSMLKMIETAMNKIWGIERSRSFPRMTADYISLMILAPILLAVGVYVSRLFRVPDTFPMASMINNLVLATVLSIVPYIVIWGVFIFIYFFMPNTKVRAFSALMGGLVGGSLWHLAQHIYIQLTIHFYAERYNLIYGTLAWMFILIVWVYFSWTILLFGAEVSQAHMSLDNFRRARRKWDSTPEGRETLALRLAALIARPGLAPLEEPFHPMNLEELSDTLMAPPIPIGKLINLYKDAGFIYETPADKRFILCRSPEDVTVLDLLRLVRHGSLAGLAPLPEPSGGEMSGLQRVGRMLSRELGQLTIKDIACMEISDVTTLRLEPLGVD